MDHDGMNGPTDWEKRRLALTLKERGQTAFMIIKHAKAAVSSAKRGRSVHPTDQQYLDLLDSTIEDLYGYHRTPGEMIYEETADEMHQVHRS